MKNKLRKKQIYIALLVLLCTLLNGCNTGNTIEEHSQSAVFFDTIISISVYNNSDIEAQTILSHCMDMCEYYTKMFDINYSDSDISHINTSNTIPCKVNPDTIELLQKSVDYGLKSDGMFDVTIYSVSSLWDFHNESNEIPDDALIKNALTHVNYHNLVLDSITNTVTLSDADSSIDIGGIAKGYIADKIAEYLSSCNISGAIINIGGDIMSVGTKNGNDKFKIGITDPSGNAAPICGVEISNMAIATSGTYERKIVKNGKVFHHILNPKTGYPVETDLTSTTIISPHSVDADTLCTICILLGSEKAVTLINSLPNTYGIFVTNENTIITTDGADQFIIK